MINILCLWNNIIMINIKSNRRLPWIDNKDKYTRKQYANIIFMH